MSSAAHDGAAVARNSAEYASFRRRLRRLRIESGLSQTEVARRLDRPQSFVSKCESGERRVDMVELLAFARIYGVGVQAFVEDRGLVEAPLRRVAEPASSRSPRNRARRRGSR